MIKAIPEGFHSVTPSLTYKDARKAVDFYKRAFGAKEKMLMPGPDGKGVMHAEIVVGDSIIMLGEEGPACPTKSAETLGTSPVGLFLYVRDADVTFQQALAAGAKEIMPVQDMFWGDRSGHLKDPFGYEWNIATHTRDLTQEQIAQGAEAFMAQMAHR